MAVNLSDLDMAEVRDHYLLRERTHQRLRQLYECGDVPEFVRLALGMTDPAGNYSAAEHKIGPFLKEFVKRKRLPSGFSRNGRAGRKSPVRLVRPSQ
jgi:hypothetical protein